MGKMGREKLAKGTDPRKRREEEVEEDRGLQWKDCVKGDLGV